MANLLYDFGRAAFLNGDISWGRDTIRAALIDIAHYAVNAGTHQYLSTISGTTGAIVATSPPLTGKTFTAGVADADDATFATVSGATIEIVVIYKDTGLATTSPLILYVDSITQITPNGGDITVEWDNGANRIFKL